jgi:ABC-type branched-subunit amino acid transport system substrate-binding protein
MFANWMTSQAHAQKVAFIYGSDEFGTSGEKSFATLVKTAGAQVVGELSTQVVQT